LARSDALERSRRERIGVDEAVAADVDQESGMAEEVGS